VSPRVDDPTRAPKAGAAPKPSKPKSKPKPKELEKGLKQSWARFSAKSDSGGAAKKPAAEKKPPAAEKKVPNGISVKGTPKFTQDATRDLDKIKSTPAGRELVQAIAKSGRKVDIKYAPQNPGTVTWDRDAEQKNGKPGQKSDAHVAYDPATKRLAPHPATKGVYDGKEAWQKKAPADVLLFHELVHARDATNGTLLPGQSKESNGKGVHNFELSAVGVKPNPLNPSSENQYREARGLPLRDGYTDLNYDPS
jgi:hypothetical protein